MELMDLDPAVEVALYKPLRDDEFRILVLEPGQCSAPLTVRLLPVSIRNAPVYDGISYVWGDDARGVVPICCDGISTKITVNLAWALARVRWVDRRRLVWADALCINQNDPSERSRQVGLMARIYSGARCVLACMGNDHNGGAAQVASLVNQCEPIFAGEWGEMKMFTFWRCAGGANDRIDRWRYLGELLGRPWFQRAWVLQEVGLAKDPRVVYGAFEFSYRVMMELVSWVILHEGDFAHEVGVNALLIHTRWADWSPTSAIHKGLRYGFVDLLDHGCLLKCRDPRDYIYAFLGHPLARGSDGAVPIIPDYTKTVAQVFAETTILLLQDAGTRALSSVEHSASTIEEDAPSWAIRWDTGFVLNNIYAFPSDLYHASAGMDAAQPQIERNALRLKGITFGIVDAVFEMELLMSEMQLRFHAIGRPGSESLSDLIHYLESSTTPCSYAGPRNHAFARTMCCVCPGSQEAASVVSCWIEYVNWRGHMDACKASAHARTYWRRLTSKCLGRTFIVTRQGLYGLAPRICRPGDVCCVLQDSDVPFILRRRQPGGSTDLRLVGEAYVHGVMQGEVVQLTRAGKLNEETFSIS